MGSCSCVQGTFWQLSFLIQYRGLIALPVCNTAVDSNPFQHTSPSNKAMHLQLLIAYAMLTRTIYENDLYRPEEVKFIWYEKQKKIRGNSEKYIILC